MAVVKPRIVPDRALERVWQDAGFPLIAGVDEVGRGPLAGPVVAGAVILPREDPAWLPALRDSKLLTAARRAQLAPLIWQEALAVGIGIVPAATIDTIGIAPASREAMRRAVGTLSPQPEALLLDAFPLPEVPLPQEALIHGDGLCCAIAAASIVAKVARDELMSQLACDFPGYGFERNRGYGTAEHLEALQRLGPSAIHRRCFGPVSALWLGR